MYNFMLAFLICCVSYIIGEMVSDLTKAWVPSVFVSAVVMLLGYWTVFPHDLVTNAGLIPFGSTICCYLQVAHMGTIISIKQLAEQWKVIVICMFGLVGMTVLALFLCPMLMDKSFVIAGLPPLTGGVVAATIMQQAAEAKGLKDAAVFAIAMYCIQGFAGYPLTAVCLQLGGRKMLKEFRANKGAAYQNTGVQLDEVNGTLKAAAHKKLLPPLPAKYNSNVMIFAKLALTGWIATMLAKIPVPFVGSISGLVWVLILSVLSEQFLPSAGSLRKRTRVIFTAGLHLLQSPISRSKRSVDFANPFHYNEGDNRMFELARRYRVAALLQRPGRKVRRRLEMNGVKAPRDRHCERKDTPKQVT